MWNIYNCSQQVINGGVLNSILVVWNIRFQYVKIVSLICTNIFP